VIVSLDPGFRRDRCRLILDCCLKISHRDNEANDEEVKIVIVRPDLLRVRARFFEHHDLCTNVRLKSCSRPAKFHDPLYKRA
jgi:hypothetical protein